MIVLSFLVSNMSGLIQTTFTLTGAIQGPLLGTFLIALFVPWANKYVRYTDSNFFVKKYN
jgi:uncharacterized membrane protein required for colicin V production